MAEAGPRGHPGQVREAVVSSASTKVCAPGGRAFHGCAQHQIKQSIHTCWVEERTAKVNWRSDAGEVQNA